MEQHPDVIMPDKEDTNDYIVFSHYEAELNQSGRWFYWLAGLSLVNSLIFLFGGNISFIFGLGITQVVDTIMLGLAQATPEMATTFKIIGFVINLVIAGMVVGMGIFALRGMGWIFIVAMIFYSMDALLFLLAGEWLSLLFHAYVLYVFFKGLKACININRLKDQAIPQVG